MGLSMMFVVAFGLAAVLTPLVGRLGTAVGLVDRPDAKDDLKIHVEPVPILGGLAVAAAVLVGLALLDGWLPPVVVGAAIVALAAGLLDDTNPVPPWARLLAQVAAGVILVGGGLRLGPLEVLSPVGVILLVIVCANSVNMIDGQDGLAGGLAAIAALGMSAMSALDGHVHVAGFSLALSGSLMGFLLWNRPPARIFLGNGGAYAVGTLLAVGAVIVTSQGGWSGLLAAGLCLGVFAFEIIFTVVRRLLAGNPIVPGDRFHSFDLLADEGLERSKITVIFWGIGLLFAGLAVLVRTLPLWGAIVVSALAWSAASLAGIRLYSIFRRRLRQPT
jgi:UDP-GlcNAc:undecaprenyl-phosphate/decaprenyl-phosphate GlcNAc-1-phosphate transferase